jgi:hypothetical protein
MEPDDVMGIEAIVGWIDPMLSRKNDSQALPVRGQRGRDGSQFDRFWTSSDNDVGAKAAQLSP